MSVNVEELRRVQRHIRRFPDKYDQSQWLCNTTACVAGRVALLNGWHPLWHSDPEDGTRWAAAVGKPGRRPRTVRSVARELLGLTPAKADLLFSGANSKGDVHQIIDDLCERAS